MHNDILDHNSGFEQTPKYVYRPFWGLFRLGVVAYTLFKQIWFFKSILGLESVTNLKIWILLGLFSFGSLLLIIYQSSQGYRELKGVPNQYSILRRVFVIYTLLLFMFQLYSSYQVVSNHPSAFWSVTQKLLEGYGLTLIILTKDLMIIRNVAKRNT